MNEDLGTLMYIYDRIDKTKLSDDDLYIYRNLGRNIFIEADEEIDFRKLRNKK